MSVASAPYFLTPLKGRQSGMSLLSLMVGVGITGILVLVIATHSSNLNSALDIAQKQRDSEHFFESVQKLISDRQSLEFSLQTHSLFDCFQRGTSPCATSTDMPFHLFNARFMLQLVASENLGTCTTFIKNGTASPPWPNSDCVKSYAVIPIEGLYLTKTGKKTVSTDPTAVWFVQALWTPDKRPYYTARISIKKVSGGVVGAEVPYTSGVFKGYEVTYYGATVGGLDKRLCFDKTVTTTGSECVGFNCTAAAYGTNPTNLPTTLRNTSGRNCYTARAGYSITSNDGFNCTGGSIASAASLKEISVPACPAGYSPQSYRATGYRDAKVVQDGAGTSIKCRGTPEANSSGVAQQLSCTVTCCPSGSE